MIHLGSRRIAAVAEFTAPDFALAPSQRLQLSFLPQQILPHFQLHFSPSQHQLHLPSTVKSIFPTRFPYPKHTLHPTFCPWKHLRTPFLIFECTPLATASDHVLDSSRAVLAASITRPIFSWSSVRLRSVFIVGSPYDCGLQMPP
jgi:hypothetical protein